MRLILSLSLSLALHRVIPLCETSKLERRLVHHLLLGMKVSSVMKYNVCDFSKKLNKEISLQKLDVFYMEN